jgi:hypothetical protein
LRFSLTSLISSPSFSDSHAHKHDDLCVSCRSRGEVKAAEPDRSIGASRRTFKNRLTQASPDDSHEEETTQRSSPLSLSLSFCVEAPSAFGSRQFSVSVWLS